MAEDILEAYRTGEPIAPLTDRSPDLTIADGYAIQRAQTTRWLADGRVIKGHKVGLTSAAMQRQMGVGRPDFGVLHDRMFYPESEVVPFSAFLRISMSASEIMKSTAALLRMCWGLTLFGNGSSPS